MKVKENAVRTAATVTDGRVERTAINSAVILHQSGSPVNGVFSCGFVREVFDLLTNPVTADEIARQTESTVDRVFLALQDLRAAGVVIT